MVHIKPFAVEQWMDSHETTARYNIAETCAASISLDDLQTFSTEDKRNLVNTSVKLTYGAIRGSEKLRSNIACLYPNGIGGGGEGSLSPYNVLVTPGAILANFLLLYTLVGPGDHVICQYPTYQQLYSVPGSFGAEVSLWKTRLENGWGLDLDELRGLIRENTKLIIINNPQNPTGKTIPTETLIQITNIAREKGIYLFGDEVYRPLFHSLAKSEHPPSILSLGYERTIVTGSMSKAYGLAGIRLGWIASNSQQIIDQCTHARDYTTISVSQLDDGIASFALDPACVDNLVSRNNALAKKNLAILTEFIHEHRNQCDWFHPLAGTTAFVRFSRDGRPVDDVKLCQSLHDGVGVLFVPGGLCFGQEFAGFVRIGYVCETEVLEKGLEQLRKFMDDGFGSVPLAE
ncbi:hypothetical protein FQN57_003299 [Myotisia sp. PD_48]|nr:hypothetical protein FQN57_003299 [Myotisia sp. PD_48]